MRMIKPILVVLIAICCGCNKSEQAIRQLEEENLRLAGQIEELQAFRDSTTQTGEGAVVLANTATHRLTSTQDQYPYLIKIHHPRDYHQQKKHYPVLYVIDAETNIGGISYVVQRLIKDKLIPEILIVGIAYDTDYDSFYRLRSRDLTPSKVKGFRPGGSPDDYPCGEAAQFASFLKEDLFPFIKDNYRIQETDRALYGHSFGGLFGSYVFMEHPELFSRYLLLSPSLWWDDKLLLRQVDEHHWPNMTAKRLFLGAGELETRIASQQSEFASAIRKKSIPGLTLEAKIFPNETHRTIFGRGIMDGLRYIYGR